MNSVICGLITQFELAGIHVHVEPLRAPPLLTQPGHWIAYFFARTGSSVYSGPIHL